ncbi:PREDICTED: F-box/LRR-repeat protein At3g59190-like [Camelina sativa]|uniref:F-box/LRR-repeat protein At3g59190-like n=1 Tax=Camelina sativa TaxID=90675 RepID=A0ABM0Z933_CAMSA|nr:PREDICTED: F-box/LRR-repeat protein At3g59190-like [Camelina sativa]XP_010512153.1 PREDICTED: F-box/LRR-repeat protein At3g59190-like [Camelina sativa]
MMNSKKMDTGSKDLISSLPDALLCHVLSFLPTTEAASTSVLAKRWRYLLAFVPNLDLDNTIYDDRPKMGRRKRLEMRKSFKLFVDRVLALQGTAPLKKFSLKCKIGSDPSRVNGWVLNVLERGVQELDLFIASEYEYPLPPKVLMSKTLVSLKVAGTDEFTIEVGEVSLPKLKTLHFSDVSFGDEGGPPFAKLISGCHALEELVMIKMMWDYWEYCSVSNPSLKRVTIDCQNIDENPKSVSFNTPNLVYLEFTDTVAAKYPEAIFDSLVEASVGIRMTDDQVWDARDLVHSHRGYKRCKGANAAGFFKGICNVKILYLSSEALEVLTFCCKKAIPVFNNLIHLTIETDQMVDWESLPKLLENSPNLETLVFKGLHYGDLNQCMDTDYRFKDTNECFGDQGDTCQCKPWYGTPLWLSSSPVKILKVLKFGEISNYKDDMERQTDLIKHFLEAMPNLEQVILYYDTPFDDDLKIVSTDLQMLKKVASTKCEIQVISDNISYSFTVHSSSSPSGLVFFKNTFPV